LLFIPDEAGIRFVKLPQIIELQIWIVYQVDHFVLISGETMRGPEFLRLEAKERSAISSFLLLVLVHCCLCVGFDWRETNTTGLVIAAGNLLSALFHTAPRIIHHTASAHFLAVKREGLLSAFPDVGCRMQVTKRVRHHYECIDDWLL